MVEKKGSKLKNNSKKTFKVVKSRKVSLQKKVSNELKSVEKKTSNHTSKVSSDALKNTKQVKSVLKEKKKSSNIFLVIVAVVVVAILAVLIAIFSNKKPNNTIQQVDSINELTDTLNVKINEPQGAEDVNYSIENDDIARMEYKKKVSDGTMMNFVLKSSSATEENITGLKNDWGTKIIMTVICDDESDIEVESYVATDNPKIMKSEWYDNDLYYSMTTDNLVTREDFLQEVNRVIINNHIEFD